MKKFLIVSFVFCLTLIVAGSTLAKSMSGFYYPNSDLKNPFLYSDLIEIDRYGNTPQFEGWYYTEKETPSARVSGPMQGLVNKYGLKYYKNDQTFAKLRYIDYRSTYAESTDFEGSYLFDNNFFIGLEYAAIEDESQTIVSPGYRFNLGANDNYVALAVDYSVDNGDMDIYDSDKNSGVIDYEVKARYYTDNSRIYGQIDLPNDKMINTNDAYVQIGGAYKVTNNLVLGGNFTDYSNFYKSYEVGCTASFDKLGAEVRYIKWNYDNDHFPDTNRIDANVLYSFNNQIRAGFEVFKQKDVDNLSKIAKVKYTLNNGNAIVFMHQLPNDEANIIATSYLYVDFKLKK